MKKITIMQCNHLYKSKVSFLFGVFMMKQCTPTVNCYFLTRIKKIQYPFLCLEFHSQQSWDIPKYSFKQLFDHNKIGFLTYPCLLSSRIWQKTTFSGLLFLNLLLQASDPDLFKDKIPKLYERHHNLISFICLHKMGVKLVTSNLQLTRILAYHC